MPELVALVPVLGRPANVAPLVESWETTRPDDSLLVFIGGGNQDKKERRAITAVQEQGANVALLIAPIASWPRQINLGASRVEADWFLCAADDIVFTPGWWERTADLRADPAIGVIGTNDSADGTGNPAVAAGEHTCHPLIRATYIRDRGTWDGPGQAVCEEYAHWFVDNELVITAKLRGAWAFCKEAVIAHRHPYWFPDEIAWDDTYALGESSAEADRDTWFRRSAQFGPLQPSENPR